MKKMTGIAAAALMAATMAGAAAIPTAANAQVTIRFGAPGFWTGERVTAIRNQIWRLEADIDRAARRGTISRGESYRLHRDARNLQFQYNRAARNGLTFDEVRYLQTGVNRVRQQLRMDRLDWDRQDYWTGNRWRDSDRDGMPNRFDRDRDGDGVPNGMDRRPNRPY